MVRRPLIITQWASQAGRSRAALEPDYVGIDERSLTELLAFAPSFGRHLRYFDEDDRPDGDWSDFFLTDGAMVLACMAEFDAAGRARRFREVSRQIEQETADALKLERLQSLFDLILALPCEVEAWYAAAERLAHDTGTDALRHLLASVIGQELAPLLARLRGYGAGAGQAGGLGHSIAVDCRHFRSIWQTEFVCPDGSIYQGHFRRQKINAALGPLAALYELLLGAVSDLADRASRDFSVHLENGRLKPHIALYIAFIRQFQVAQSRLNELPGRVIDFYYREILREPLRPALPDRMFLTFTRAPGIVPARVARGTAFPAGADATGKPVLFLADQSLNVERARLVRVRALRTTRGPLCDAANGDASALVADRLHRVNVTDVVVAPDGSSADGKPWAPFGAAASGPAESPPQPAPLGFAIVSRSLLLTGGQRSITVSLRSDPQFCHAVLEPLLQHIASVTGLSAETALAQLLTQAFGFSVTIATGWYEIAPRHVAVSPDGADGRSLSFQFAIAPGAPPLVAAAPAGAPLDAGAAPALLARLRQDPVTLTGNSGTATVHPLSLLEGLPVADIVIEVGVVDLPGVTIKTRGGPVDATIPFLPFGAPARAGTWFDIQHPELFTKPLDQLKLSIDWLGLPAHPNGFAGYYEQYVVGPDRKPGFAGFANDSFRATARLVGDAAWSLPQDAKPLYLFRTGNAGDPPQSSGPLKETSDFEFAVRPRLEATPPEAASAALRITLTDPSYGFGEELHAPNVLHAVHLAQAPPPPQRRLLCRLIDYLLPWRRAPAAPPDAAAFYPNPPWQPEVTCISVSYHSIAKVDVRGAEPQALLHLLPTGALAPAAADADDAPLLLPKLAEPAQFDLGFADFGVTQTLTMLFRMTDDGVHGDDGDGVGWRALGADGWIDLAPAAACRDGCNGLRHSGIISLDLPPMAPDAAEHLYWIRAVPLRDPDSFPGIVAITPHALTATRTINAEAGPLPPIPAKTVKAAATQLPGVATVDQPIASFGGRDAETPATLPIRLGERLRHKERASLGWDHERLVLERFPDIARIRVLPACDVAGSRKPGELLVVAVPDPGSVSATDPLLPKIGTDTRGRIQASLQAACSPFVRIHVADPVYVRVAVAADIVFRTDAAADGPTQLDADLRAFLSPWSRGLDLPDEAGLDEIRVALANFIATRPYVAGLITLELGFDPSFETLDWCVLASAASHAIRIARPETAPVKLHSKVSNASDRSITPSETPLPRLPPVSPWSPPLM